MQWLKRKNDGLKNIPGPNSLWLLGNALDMFTMEIHERLYQWSIEYGDFVKFQIFSTPKLFINSPELLETVLISQREQYYKKTPTKAFKPLVRDSIFIANKPAWISGRQHHPYTQGYASLFFETITPETINTASCGINTLVPDKTIILEDFYPYLTRLIFDVFSQNVLGENLKTDQYQNFIFFMDETAFRLKTGLPSWNPRFRNSLDAWYSEIKNLIHRARQNPQKNPTNILSYIALKGTKLPDSLLLDEISTLLTGGIHPVSTGIMAVLFLINKHPDEGGKVVKEIRAFYKNKQGTKPTLKEIQELPLLDRFIDESMRLYSPVALITRAVKKGQDNQLGGVKVPGNIEVLMSNWAMHRSPKYWDNPLRFIPSRFKQTPDELLFWPFGIGERTCVGINYARACQRIVLATLLNEFDFHLSCKVPLKMKYHAGFLQPRESHKIKIQRI